MAEYIEREALLDIFNAKADMATGTPKECFFADAKMVGLLPAADVVEVRHGEWLPSRNGINPIRCDKCNMPALFVQEQDGFGGFGFYRCPSNYCPNCGAKMDGKGDK